MPPPLQIARSDRAKRDLLSIYNHVAAEASLEIAAIVIASLFEGMHRAAANQVALQKPPDLLGLGGPHRINVFTYAVLYQPFADGKGIYVLGIVHGRPDIRRRLRQDVAPWRGIVLIPIFICATRRVVYY
jgi:plasmid stabilization system protein ParE